MVEANFRGGVAVRALACLVHTGHPEPKGAPWWQVCDIVVAVRYTRGRDQPVLLSWKTINDNRKVGNYAKLAAVLVHCKSMFTQMIWKQRTSRKLGAV